MKLQDWLEVIGFAVGFVSIGCVVMLLVAGIAFATAKRNEDGEL